MAEIAFVITNDRHHHDILFPVARALSTRHDIRLISFCEFRGLKTPSTAWQEIGARITRVPPFNVRPSTSSPDTVISVGSKLGARRSRLHDLTWALLLRPFLRIGQPDLALFCNDAAFPGSRLVDLLNQNRIPFILVPEGIRFPLPGETTGAFGTRGAAKIACWGQASADYFTDLGVTPAQLSVTGCPRYDGILAQDWPAHAQTARHSGALPEAYVLLATNPIDDQGFCSRQEKLDAFAEFAISAIPELAQRGLSLLLKTHPRESIEEYRSALPTPLAAQLLSAQPGLSLHTALSGARAVIVWASTAGLEALMHARPLGVLAVPGHGFVFDYVQSGAAIGFSGNEDITLSLTRLLQGPTEESQVYIERHVANRGCATEAVTRLVEQMLHEPKTT